jgi:type VI secretion system protein ImpB
MSSVHDQLGRVRPPRVHIRYDVHNYDAEVGKELPFVVGVMGDYSGNASTAKFQPLADRKFTNIDRDNFNDVMAKVSPGLNLRVENTLKGDKSELAVNLNFKNMNDFEPGQIVKQVPALSKMLETRNKLRDLLTQADKSANLEALLEQILQNPEDMAKLKAELDK